MTRYDADGNRDTALNRARRFFTDNPDEMLTRQDIAVKFDCGPDTANLVARELIRSGVATREQLPRPVRRSQAKPAAIAAQRTFPDCLTTGQREAVEALIKFGSITAAAANTGRRYATLADLLKGARRRAGVHTTAALAVMFVRACARQPEAEAA